MKLESFRDFPGFFIILRISFFSDFSVIFSEFFEFFSQKGAQDFSSYFPLGWLGNTFLPMPFWVPGQTVRGTRDHCTWDQDYLINFRWDQKRRGPRENFGWVQGPHN